MQITFTEPSQYGKFDVIIEGMVTIKGCRHMVSDRYDFVAFPQYLKRDKDGVAVKNTKTGKDLYISDYVIDRAFEAQITAAYKATLGTSENPPVGDGDDIPF